MKEYLEIQQQLSCRRNESVEALKTSWNQAQMIIHSVYSDIGVARNGGRRGARFGADAVLSSFKKLTYSKEQSFSWTWENVAPDYLDNIDFTKAQAKERDNIKINLEKSHVHLGGGHDHIYPLLMALQCFQRPLHVINVDAHLDTRIDRYAHSGTPFRQFAEKKTVPFRLSQIGIHPFCNAQSNYTDLPKSKMQIIEIESLDKLTLPKDELTIFSLDCDALDSSFFSGVSAVNAMGLTKKQFGLVWNFYLESIKHQPIVGIYEYNPIYDDLSGQGAKFLSVFLYSIALKRMIYS